MKVVIFTVKGKEYGVDIANVRQVIRMKEIVPVPDAADFVEGVICLRTKVVPVVNLSKKLGMKDDRPDRWARIIVTQLEGHTIGVVVDMVTDVITIDPASISAPDDVLKDAGYLIGVAKIGPRLILIADIDKLLSADERTSIEKVSDRVEVKKKEQG
jgi:purine-binding chemotaxis protein CheW